MEHSPTIQEALNSRKYNPNYKPIQETPVLTIRDKTIATIGNLILFTGLPAAGKSTFINACIASAFVDKEVFGIKINKPATRNRVAYFDTEMSEFSFYKGMDRIKIFTNSYYMPDAFDAFQFRDLEPDQIKECVEYYLENTPDCSILFIDGLLDMIFDYNDVKESKRLTNWVKKITKKYSILCAGVLHVGKKDLNTLGHFGSMLDRTAQSVLTIEKDKDANILSLSAKKMRDDYGLEPIRLMATNGFYEYLL
jgi:hypothetical protein